MCGIVGSVSTKPIANARWIADGRELLKHRGPDAFGEWISNDRKAIFQHQRLAIIDLSKKSNQPMVSEDKSKSIVFNGEIYNYLEIRKKLVAKGIKFRTKSDTEVIIKAYENWGYNCLNYLNGMFAFALYDKKEQNVFVARDRAGEKPLFYYHDKENLSFASELKGLFSNSSVSRSIDLSSLDLYLHFGYIPGSKSIIRNIFKLPAAHALTFNLSNGNLRVWRYWSAPPLKLEETYTRGDLLENLEALLKNAVKIQLAADVPVGVLLSGGVDSSLITALASSFSTNVKTFTIKMQGDSTLDESKHARLVADYFSTDHYELEAEPANIDCLSKLAYFFDEPMADSSMIPTYLVSKLVSNHCKVALGGDGGDELFGGYSHHSSLLWLESSLGKMPLKLRRMAAGLSRKILPIGFKGKNWLETLGTDLEKSLPLVGSFFNKQSRQALLPILCSLENTAEQIMSQNIPLQTDLLQRITRMDFENYLPNDILVKVDRASMANSLEVRAPFLDRYLMEFAFSRVPSFLKANPTEKKILLKLLTEKLLPREFDRKRKQGFSIPLQTWLKSGPFRNYFQEVLKDRNCSFSRSFVDKLFKGLDSGRANSERLFALMHFELWKNEHKISF